MKRPSGKTANAEAPAESDRLEGFAHPRTTPVLFGHGAAEAGLLGLYRAGRLPQAILIGGREGIGKATLAWRLARFLAAYPDPDAPGVVAVRNLSAPMDHPAVKRILGLAHSDISLLRREWDSEKKKHFTEIKADHARAATHVFQRSSGEGGYRICIVDCAEDLNAQSGNALLKIIEEPPARSLFLIVAHRPAAVLPTIRSRCRKLSLMPLGEGDMLLAVKAAGQGMQDRADSDIQQAASSSGGSVRLALQRLSQRSGPALDGLWRVLDGLPRLDWEAVHRLADEVAPRTASAAFDRFVETTLEWLHVQATAAGKSAACLAPFAEVWEKLRHEARESEAYNLDKKPLILLTFADLAEAARRAQRTS